MLGKRDVNFEVEDWEEVNCPHNDRREKDVLEKFN